MPDDHVTLTDRLTRVAPFDRIPEDARADLSSDLQLKQVEAGGTVFAEGAILPGLFVIESGAVEVVSTDGDVISHRGAGEFMGERGILRGGKAILSARATQPTELLVLSTGRFQDLIDDVPEIGRWFERAGPVRAKPDDGPYATGLMSVQVADIMARTPVSCSADSRIVDVARTMRDRSISSVLVMRDTDLIGIVTVHDLVNKVLAEGLGGDLPVGQVMTANPITILPDAVGLDALLAMAERRINHLPVADRLGRIVGMVGRTDLFRQQAATASHMASEIVAALSASEMAGVMARLPELLSFLTTAGTRPDAICRRITDLTDAVTRRLLVLAEEKLGPAPVPYLWAACGSQGRREQTGVSDQDNCLILDDSASDDHDAYFSALAKFVSDGMHEVGFVYCPGDMMATNPRWRQPRRVWREYFAKWIAEPDEEAQMLASVMFDLRPIAGDTALFDDLQAETLRLAKGNSIFVRHMIVNSLKHTPPLGLFRGLAVIRSGDHKNRLDLKHSGVVPVVDLGRVYALRGGLTAINTRQRIIEAAEMGVISTDGGRELLDAYDLISETRLRHQAAQIAEGGKPDNFLAPATMSDLERNHLRDAFLIVRTMQSSLGSGT
ncbi:MAG: DUF294 nucleotidyltransferase-like domain-containing protein [Pseudomonadota bacterium]